MDVSTVTAPTVSSATAAATPSNRNAMISSDFETFLKMLTTQMQNQDPLNPMDSADYAVQLATFSGVEQQMKTNQLLQGLGGQMGMMGMAQLAGWVGMEARAAAPAWFDGSPVTLAPNPASLADQAVLIARNAQGQEVAREQIALGADTMDWVGIGAMGHPLPSGLYSFALESYSEGNLLSTSPVEVYAPIIEARTGAGDTILLLEGGVEVSSTSVTALRAP
jgi:flagellar basal-body rod modification protein FlgD